MQDVAYLMVNGEKILVLRRSAPYGVKLKIRFSGKDGMFLEDESIGLEDAPERLAELKEGLVVYL